MKRILLDSDVIIEHFRNNQSVHQIIEELLQQESQLFYTAVTEAEIYHGMRPREEKYVLKTLKLFTCLPVHQKIGQKAGLYLHRFAKSHGLDVADALIAATAYEEHLTLWTFNRKHYPMEDIEKFNVET